MGLAGRCEAIKAPTVGYASDSRPISTARMGSALSPVRGRLDSGVVRSSKRVSVKSTTHATHNDHARRVAAWLPTPESLTGSTSPMRVGSLKSDSPMRLPFGRGERVYEETNDREPSGTSPPLAMPRHQYTNCNGYRLVNRLKGSPDPPWPPLLARSRTLLTVRFSCFSFCSGRF
jgi:hypothetical protein